MVTPAVPMGCVISPPPLSSGAFGLPYGAPRVCMMATTSPSYRAVRSLAQQTATRGGDRVMRPEHPRARLIVNADDFGRTDSINAAVLQAHTEGILTSCSLMVTGDAADAAARMAREHEDLAV